MKISKILGVALSTLLMWGVVTTTNAQNSSDEGDYIKKKDVTAIEPLPAEIEAQAKAICDGFSVDPEKAGNDFLKLMRKTKGKEAYASLGRFFADQKNYQCAKICADQVYKADPTYVPGLILYGDVSAMRHDWGMAGQKYDEALLQDSMLVDVLKKSALVYKYVNPLVTIEYLSRLKRIDPEYYDADRILGEVYYNLKQYDDAIKSYKVYDTKATDPKLNNLSEYALALYITQKYDQALAISNKVLAKDSTILPMKRVRFYSLYELKDYDGANAAMSFLNDKSIADTTFTYSDYKYEALVLEKKKKHNEAIEAYLNAHKAKPTEFEPYKNIALIYRKKMKYEEAIKYFKLFLDSMQGKATIADSFDLGKTYFFALQNADENVSKEKKEIYLKDADAVFAKISEANKTHYLGPLFRARLNNTLDSENPHDNVLAYYKEAYDRSKDKSDLVDTQAECLKYMAWYYLQKDNYEESHKYCSLLLKADPEDTLGQQIMKYLNQEMKKKGMR